MKFCITKTALENKNEVDPFFFDPVLRQISAYILSAAATSFESKKGNMDNEWTDEFMYSIKLLRQLLENCMNSEFIEKPYLLSVLDCEIELKDNSEEIIINLKKEKRWHEFQKKNW